MTKKHFEAFKHSLSQSIYSNAIFIHGEFEDFKISIKYAGTPKAIEAIEYVRINFSRTVTIIVEVELFKNDEQIQGELNLSHCSFHNKVEFINCTFFQNVDFKDCSFLSKFNVLDCEFKKKVRFHESVFEMGASFDNTTFNDLVDFYFAKFRAIQQFLLTDFLGVTIFSNATFFNQVQFLYNKTSSDTIISFESTTFEQGIDISRSNFWCKIHFWNATINDNPDWLWLYGTDLFEDNKSDYNSAAYKRLRESFRIIKNEFRKESNQTDSLLAQKSELSLLRRELKHDSKSKVEDKLALWFYKVSNNYGTSWIWSLFFTIIVSSFFYLLFLWSILNQLNFEWTSSAIKNTLLHFIEFLNITNWNFNPFGISNYGLSYALLFVGRLFIGFAYYQFIQAFRRFGKT